MATGVLELRAGARLWFDGQAWTVCEVHAGTVRLQDGSAGFRAATIGDLLQSASGLDGPKPDRATVDGLSSVALASLSTGQRAAVDREAVVLTPLLATATGCDDTGSDSDGAVRLGPELDRAPHGPARADRPSTQPRRP